MRKFSSTVIFIMVLDVRALLPNESMINDSAPRTFREYNTEQMIPVDSPGNTHKVGSPQRKQCKRVSGFNYKIR